MSDIKFNCPRCGQHLAVDATGASTTVVCPKCEQAILVPELGRFAELENSGRAKWRLAAAIAMAAIFAGAVLIWQSRQRSTKGNLVTTQDLSSDHTNRIVETLRVNSPKEDLSSGHALPPQERRNVAAHAETGAVSPTAVVERSGTLPANAYAALSDWFVVLDGTNGFHVSAGVPGAAIAAFKAAQQSNDEIRSFSFTPAGGWVLLDNDGFEMSSENVPGHAHLKNSTKAVAFSPGGPWIILWGRNGFWGPGSAAWLKVKELLNSGHQVRTVSFGSGNSFVVLFDETGIAYKDVPASLARVLDNAVSNQIPIQCVAFNGLNWICLARDKSWTSDARMPAAKVIEQEFRRGLHPKWVAFVPNLGRFDPNKFATLLRGAMAGNIAGGYECVVIDHGKTVVALAKGWARAPWERVDPAVGMTVNKPMEIASVSKTITAVALLRLYEECTGTGRQFSLDEPFWPHIQSICPYANDEVKKITIRQVLEHRSGFIKNRYGRGLNGLRRLLLLPLARRPGTRFLYQNINYSIIRFLIEQIAGIDYTTYVKGHVLAPMGITDMETHSEGQDRTCYYGELGTQMTGEAGFRNLSSTAGSYGWYASAVDLGKFLEGIRQCKVLTPATTAIMLKEKLGWDSGHPWAKGGLDFWARGQVHSVIAYFPDGVESVILQNCQGGPNIEAFSIQAWKKARY